MKKILQEYLEHNYLQNDYFIFNYVKKYFINKRYRID